MYTATAMRPSYRARICKPVKESGIDNQPHGIDSLESIPELLKCLQIRALYAWLRSIASISCRYKTRQILGECRKLVPWRGGCFHQESRAQHEFSLSWLGPA